MSAPVDTSAEAVERAIGDQWAAAVTGWQMTVCDRTAALLRALAKERANLESLLAERNRQNAAAFTASDAYQKRMESLDLAAREAVEELLGAIGEHAEQGAGNARRILDAALAGEDMGSAKEGQ